MIIVYPYPEELPSTKARAKQVMNTVCALAKETRVLFYPSAFTNSVFDFYGLEKPKRLTVEVIKRKYGPITWHNLYLRNLIKRLKFLRKRYSKIVVYTRHIKLAHSLAKSKLIDVLILYEVHEIFSHKRPKLHKYEKDVFKNMDGLIFLSDGLRDIVTRNNKIEQPFAVIRSGLSLGENVSKKVCSGPCNEIFYVGSTRYEWKGVQILIEAMAKISGVTLNMVGDVDGEIKSTSLYQNLIAKRRIKEWGFVAPSAIPTILEKAKIGVLPTTDKYIMGSRLTCPLKLLDYMASKLAIIATDIPSTKELVDDREVFFVKPGDPDALADGIKRLIEDPDLRENLARNALYKAKQFSWEKRAKMILLFLADLVRET